MICTLSDLQALVPVYHTYEVDKDGCTTDWLDEGSQQHDRLDIEEYCCRNCGEFFTPDKRYSYQSLDLAWQQATNHVSGAIA